MGQERNPITVYVMSNNYRNSSSELDIIYNSNQIFSLCVVIIV